MNDYSLTDQELTDLQILHRELSDKRQADRVKAIILLGSGHGWTLAQILLLDRTTVRRYHRDYKKGGAHRLLEHELDGYLQEHLHITVKSVVAYVEERWEFTIAQAA